MARIISQDTFNDVVKENVEEFSMSPEEAVEDAVKQFQAQGVDLSNIMKAVTPDMLVKQDTDRADCSITRIAIFAKTGLCTAIITELESMLQFCERGIAYRMYVANQGFFTICVNLLEMCPAEGEMKVMVFTVLTAMVTDQPDIFNEEGQQCTVLHLEQESDPGVLVILLKLLKVGCIKHETNRQQLMSMKVVPALKRVLDDFSLDVDIVRGVCSAFRVLVLDDDIRHEFGHSHERAREICETSLTTLVELLHVHFENKDVLGDILLTLCAVVVRNEFCQTVGEAGNGLSYVVDIFTNFPDSEKLNRTCLKFIKVLSGNDVVKAQIVRTAGADFIVDSMIRHQTSAELTAAANGCIAALCLRSPSNSECFAKVDAAAAILDGMRAHPMDQGVQKQGCWAIRNIVSRSRHLCPLFLESGAEELLNYVLENLAEECEYDAKSALRDLGCSVTLREEWTGKGGALN